MELKNNDWNVPTDYFEKNKKALLPVRKFPTGKWILALAAACAVGVGLFMWKEDGRTQEVAQGERREDVRAKHLSPEIEDVGSKHLPSEIEDVGSKHLSPAVEDTGAKHLSTKHLSTKYLSPRIAEELKEIPRDELVAYLLEQDSELIETLN
ncbi:MAG: hypothetical protein RLZZ71_552 [Bacteroidota bacterium]|jgi:hypothetical protein